MTDIVLVHGAFHGGWCWRQVAGRLRALGHRVFTPTLTGLGERSHLMSADVGLETHVQDITNLFEWEELEAAVLLGHSYGGMPITGAADRIADRLAALVYLDAILPEDGESALSIRSAEPGAVPLPRSADGITVPTPPATVFGLEGDQAAQADRLLTPHPLATMSDPVHLTGAWRRVARKLYIRCGQYPGSYFDRFLAAAEADPDWIAIGTDLPHNIMMTDPDWLVGVFEEHLL